MDYGNLDIFTKIILNLGLVGAIFVIWYVDMRRMNHMREMMNNLEALVRQYHELASDTTNVVRENIRVYQKMVERMPTQKEISEMLYLVIEKLTRIEERLFRSTQDF